MATNTPNYNLIKPDPSDYYDIAVFNDNADKIDTALASKRNSDDPITVGWDDVTEKPTDIAGYGILDAVTSALKNPQISLRYQVHCLRFPVLQALKAMAT